MKIGNKIFLAAIFILALSILGIRIYLLRIDQPKPNTESGQVKSAQVDKKTNVNYVKLATLPEFSLPPQKKDKVKNPLAWFDSGIVLDEATFYPLWQKNAHKRVPIASTTKIMSAIIVLENYKLDDVIEISQKAATQIGSDGKLKTGEKISIESVFKTMLVISGNDAAYALAEQMGVDNFVAKMNAKAKELGLQDTQFKDPAGLDDSGYSSAFDLSVMAAYAMQKKQFAGIVSTAETTVYSTDGQIEHKLESSNRLIKSDNPFYSPQTKGIKTGFTPVAGHCLVGASDLNGHNIITVVLNTAESTVEASAKETKKLIDWTANSFNL